MLTTIAGKIGLNEVLLSVGVFLAGVGVKIISDMSKELHSIAIHMAAVDERIAVTSRDVNALQKQIDFIEFEVTKNHDDIIKLRAWCKEQWDKTKKVMPH